MPDSVERNWRASIRDFLWRPIDGVSAAWLRIAFAIVLPFFFRPRAFITGQNLPPSLNRIYDVVFLTNWYWLATVALCAVLAIGWRSRPIAWILILMLLPLDILSSARPSRQVMLFALLAFSFVRSDAVRFPWGARGERRATAGPAWPIRLMQLLLTIIYGANALAKSRPGYLSGDVLMDMSAALPNFHVDFSSGFLDIGPLSIPVAVAAIASALAEYFLALGFWVVRRKWIVAAFGVGFHVTLTYIVSIYMLDYATVFLYLAFLLHLATRPSR